MPSFEGDKILIIGDSLSDGTGGDPGTYGVPPTPSVTPGQFLAEELKARGAASVRIQAKLGRSAYTFVNKQSGMDIIAKEIRDNRPDVVFIILGTNDALLGAKPTKAAFEKMKAAFDAAGIPVYHVGPPAFPASVSRCVQRTGETCTKTATMNNLAAGVVTIGKALFGDRFVDTRGLTQDILTSAQGRAGDGIHFKAAGAKKFATRLADTLESSPEIVTRAPPGLRPGPLALGAGITIAAAVIGVIMVLRS